MARVGDDPLRLGAKEQPPDAAGQDVEQNAQAAGARALFDGILHAIPLPGHRFGVRLIGAVGCVVADDDGLRHAHSFRAG